MSIHVQASDSSCIYVLHPNEYNISNYLKKNRNQSNIFLNIRQDVLSRIIMYICDMSTQKELDPPTIPLNRVYTIPKTLDNDYKYFEDILKMEDNKVLHYLSDLSKACTLLELTKFKTKVSAVISYLLINKYPEEFNKYL